MPTWKNKEKAREYHLDRFYQDKEKWQEYEKETKRKKKEMIDEIKSSTGCKKCGYNAHPICLDFHHVGEKKIGIPQAINRKWSNKRILEEISKCVVLCANCHRLEHLKDSNYVSVV